MDINPVKFARQRFGLILGMLAAICLTAGAMIASTAQAAPVALESGKSELQG